jgi:PTH1 family peptidyl-tRNA hydrolase
LDALADALSAPPWHAGYQGWVTAAGTGDDAWTLLKPGTFMNRSGQSVAAACADLDLSPQQVVVVHDEVDLARGRVMLKQGGGEAGHNGLKSVSACLGSRDYLRLRVGVGRPASGPLAEYLLSPLDEAERAGLTPSVELCVEALRRLGSEGHARCMAWLHPLARSTSLDSPRGPERPADEAFAESLPAAADATTKVEEKAKDRL